MDAPLQDCTIEEQRGVVRFLWAEGVKPVEIHRRNGSVVFSDVVRGDSHLPQVSLLLPKETALRHVVLRWCNLAKERPCFRPPCCQSTEGRALYCKWLNISTGTVYTAQCASSSLSRLRDREELVHCAVLTVPVEVF